MSVLRFSYYSVAYLGLAVCLSLALPVLFPEAVSFQGHADVTSVSPDGTTLATRSQQDQTIKLWDVATRTIWANLHGNAVVFSPDGKMLALVNEQDQTITVWKVATRKEQATLQGQMTSLAFSPRGKILAAVGKDDNTVHLWDVATGQELRTLPGQTSPLAFSPDGNTLASASCNESVKLWDVASSKELRAYPVHNDSASDILFSPVGNTLAIVSHHHLDGTIQLWDVTRNNERVIFRVGNGWIHSLVFSPDGTTVATGDAVGALGLWDVITGMNIASFNGREDMENVVFSADGRLVASRDVYETVYILDVARGKMTTWNEGSQLFSSRPRLFRWVFDTFPGVFEGHQRTVRSIMFTPDGKLVAFGHDEQDRQTVKMWVVAAFANKK
jgi:WD40 repeat protein